jgi:hypothetical protein
MDPVRYDAKTLAALRAQTLKTHPLPQITETDTTPLFAIRNLSLLTQAPRRPKNPRHLRPRRGHLHPLYRCEHRRQ